MLNRARIQISELVFPRRGFDFFRAERIKTGLMQLHYPLPPKSLAFIDQIGYTRR